MKTIYEPKGRAREYADLACNLYTGCKNACKYCYCPGIMRKSLSEWSSKPVPKKNIIQLLESDLQRIDYETKKNKSLLFCFMSDPYQDEKAALITNKALELCNQYGKKKIMILTKNPILAIDDFHFFKSNPTWTFGVTICFDTEKLRIEWEPLAHSIESRYIAIRTARLMGIKVWLSIEPVIDPGSALIVMGKLRGTIDHWKVGKLNHNKEIEKQIDWKSFYSAASEILSGEDVYWKKDLLSLVCGSNL